MQKLAWLAHSTKGWLLLWTMKSSWGSVRALIDVELVPGPLRFTPRKKCQSDHEGQGPHKTYCKAYIIQ